MFKNKTKQKSTHVETCKEAKKDQQNHKEHVGGEPGHFLHSEGSTVHRYSRCWFCSIFSSLSSFTQCWSHTGLPGRFLQCLLPWKQGCWWSIYSDSSLWLSEVAPFCSDIRHWPKVLPFPSQKPYGPSQCPQQFTSSSRVSPLIWQQVKEMCPKWPSRWTLQYQLQDFPLQVLPLCKDSEVTPGPPPPSFTLFRRITSNMGNAKSQFPSVREEFPDGTALFT